MTGRRALKHSALTALVVVAAFAAITPAAFAGTTIGASCTAPSLGPDVIFNESHVVGTNGVITSWGSKIDPGPSFVSPMSLKLKIVNRVSGQVWKVVGESAPSPFVIGANTFSVRIPVKAGDVIGSWAQSGMGASGSPYCNSGLADFHYNNDNDADVPVGATFNAGNATGIENAVWAVVEPDVDGDGFGDESQDKCPTSAASQSASPCPAPPISSFIDRTSKSLTVYASSALAAPVQVVGTVKVPKSKSITITSATTTVTPFSITAIKLKYSKALRKAIAAAPRKKPLKISVAIRGGAPLAKLKTVSVKLTPLKK